MDDLLRATISLVLIAVIFAIWIANLKGLIKAQLIIPVRVSATVFVSLVAAYLLINLRDIKASDWVLISLYVGLVGITAVYAFAAQRQAKANEKMAEEMREQRRPIVVQKSAPAISTRPMVGIEYIKGPMRSDYFEIRNKGNSPAIELEILLLGQDKNLLNSQRITFLSQDDEPIEFHPQGLINHISSTCYLLCRYCSTFSSDTSRMWYETWLPFKPKKSQRGDRIIIEPGELKFRVTFKKKSY